MTQHKISNKNKKTIRTDLPDKSLPQIMREKRKLLNIDVSQAASYLKVKTRDLEAIENNDSDFITNHLYILGIVRSYAIWLGIEQEIIKEKIKFLTVASNVGKKKYNLINIGENIDLKPTRNQFVNFLLVSIILFLILISSYIFYEDGSKLITTKILVNELEKVIP